MQKKIIAILLLVCLILFILPVKTNAAAAGAGIIIGGTAYAAGSYTFATLPPTVQGIINSTAKDYQNQLFPSKSSIVLLDPHSGIGGGGNNNNKQPVTPPTMWTVITTLILNAVYEIKEAGDDIYQLSVTYLDPVIEEAFSDYKPSEAELDLAKEIVQKGVDSVNDTEFGNKPLTVEEFTDKTGYDYKAFLDSHGLIDNGKSFLSGLKEYNPYIQDIKVFDYNNMYYYADLSSCPSWSSDVIVNYARFYIIQDNKLIVLTDLTYLSSNSCVEFKVENNVFCRRFNSSGAFQIIKTFSEPYPENIIMIIYKPAKYSGGEYVSHADITNSYTIVPDDLIEVPGVNPNNLTDVEKAAAGLAAQLGVDLGVINSQFNVVYDENGNKYFEQISTGNRYSVDDFMKVFDEINTGNTAIIENLQKLLDQLKAQDITGLENIVSQIESNIDDLNNRDKNREEVYTNITETIGQIKAQLEKNYIDPSTIDEINKNIADISAVISPMTDPIQIDEDKLKAPATITKKFPFSLPFDIYHIFNVFSADPVTPEFDVPIDMSTVGGEVYNVHIDLSRFDFIAEIVRWLMYAVFIAGLIILTNRLIGRG